VADTESLTERLLFSVIDMDHDAKQQRTSRYNHDSWLTTRFTIAGDIPRQPFSRTTDYFGA
jgi:hypothetical protein